MDDVFKALADPTRRTLIDLLAERDGRTLSELDEHFDTTRFSTMKHLRVLEAAGLVNTRKVGREKYHYLNPVPIQLVYDRWVSAYARPFTKNLADLKTALEAQMTTASTTKPVHVYEILIRTTPEKLWQALTDPAQTPHYLYSSRLESEFKPNSPWRSLSRDGKLEAQGTILESDPPRYLRMTFGWGDEAEANTVVAYTIEPRGELCSFTLTHEGLDAQNPASRSIVEGWTYILSGLKTFLETGEPLEPTV